MNGQQPAWFAMHLVVLSAAVLSAAARVVPIPQLQAVLWEWHDAEALLCRQPRPAHDGYLHRLGWVLQEQDTAALVPYDAPDCGR